MKRLMVIVLAGLGPSMIMPARAADPSPAPPAAAPSPPAGAPSAETADQRTPVAADAMVYIFWPRDGAVIHGQRFRVWFGSRNVGIAPAGVKFHNSGHHHLLIDVPLPPLDEPIPNDRRHLHFGLGQTETVLELPPGKHTLQLILGDADHVPHNPPLISKKITVTIEK